MYTLSKIINLLIICIFIYLTPLTEESFGRINSRKAKWKGPKVEIKLLDDGRKFKFGVFEYAPSFNGKPQPPYKLSVTSAPTEFSEEKIILFQMEDNDSSNEAKFSGRVPIRIQLTCSSEYFTKWRVNSISTDSVKWDEESGESYINYEIDPLPRNEENPLKSENSESEFESDSDENDNSINEILQVYNLTSLTIRWFGANFQSGFIDCVQDTKEMQKTRLFIFRKFSQLQEGRGFDDSQSKNLVLSHHAVIPCKVHDPASEPKLLLNTNSKWNNPWHDLSRNFTYDWKIGFKPSDFQIGYRIGHKFRCILGNQSINYTFVNARSLQQQTSSQNRKEEIKDIVELEVVQNLNARNSNANSWKFVCSLDKLKWNSKDKIKFIRLASCVSPDYCNQISSVYQNFVVEKNCSQMERDKCELRLPYLLTSNDESTIPFQGMVSCFAEIKGTIEVTREHYFMGLSSKVYLLLRSPPFEEIMKLEVTRIDHSTTNGTGLIVLCTALNFFTFPTIKFSLTFKNGTTNLLTFAASEQTNVTKTKRVIQQQVTIKKHVWNLVQEFGCHAPLFNSPKWIHISTTLSNASISQNTPSTTTFLTFTTNPTLYPTLKSDVVRSFKKTYFVPKLFVFPPPKHLIEEWADHKQKLFLFSSNDNVAFYLETNSSLNATLIPDFKTIAKAWQSVRKKYGIPFQPFLYVIFHSQIQIQSQNQEDCVSPEIYHTCQNCSVKLIDCGPIFLIPNWRPSSAASTFKLMESMGHIATNLAEQNELWPANWGSDQWQIQHIILIDIYNEIGMLKEASRFLERQAKARNGRKDKSSMLKEWYLNIYKNYGEAKVFNIFVSLLNKYWYSKQLNGHDGPDEELNFGEFIHFWSGACGFSLKQFANNTFGWREEYEKEFTHAKEDYPLITYVNKEENFGIRPENPPQSSSIIIIFSVVFSGILIVIIAGVLCLVGFYRKRILGMHKEIVRELTNEEIKSFYDGQKNTSLQLTEGYAFIESEPFNKEYEIPRERLSICHDKILGSGQFGLVLEGLVKGVPAPIDNEYKGQRSNTVISNRDTVVAIKTVRPNVDVAQFMAMLTELKVMGYLGIHENIASLLGAFTVNIRKREVYIALEYCAKGDLLGFLTQNRSFFKDLIHGTQLHGDRAFAHTDDDASKEVQFTSNLSRQKSRKKRKNSSILLKQLIEFSSIDLLRWSLQVAKGIEYISSKNVIHGDLAARNILLTEDNTAKISDFGLSRQLANYSAYMKTSVTPLPWKWMAIESLRDMKFSLESDIWAFGVTLFEIFSLGTTPYPGCNWTMEFLDELIEGTRLNAPKYGDDKIYNLMMDCMKQEPEDRIKISKIVEKLQDIISYYGFQVNFPHM